MRLAEDKDMSRRTVTVLTLCPATRTTDGIRVDRKFHLGMLRYADLIDARIRCLVPEGTPDSLDRVEAPTEALPYEVAFLSEPGAVEATLRDSNLLYGMNPDVLRRARRLGVPYVMVTEHNWSIRRRIAQLSVTDVKASVSRRVKSFARQMRRVKEHVEEQLQMLGSLSVHCNGYPAYENARGAPRRLLYFDSRIRRVDVAAEDVLTRRFETFGRRPVRLIYSGRLEEIKGPQEILKAADHLVRVLPDFTLDYYGDGSMKKMLSRMIADFGLQAKVRLHDPIPFSALMLKVREADLFLSGHVQADPSCTYMETLGCGVPIAGYANQMWAALVADSGAGVATPLRDPAALADAVVRVVTRPNRLRGLAHRARSFALARNFDAEFQRRVEDLEGHLARV